MNQPLKELDEYFPSAGECAFCGFKDKRHRLWDVIIEMYDSGSSVLELSQTFDLPLQAIQKVIEIRPYNNNITCGRKDKNK